MNPVSQKYAEALMMHRNTISTEYGRKTKAGVADFLENYFSERQSWELAFQLVLAERFPKHCALHHPETGKKIRIDRGVMGYFDLPNEFAINVANSMWGASQKHVSAMLVGSMFGWDVPLANPDRYDDEGQLISLKGEKS